MRIRSKLILTSLAAALLLAIAVSSASANKISVSHGNLFRIEWSSIELWAAGIAVVRCALTLEGSFHSTTLPKIERVLVGHITRASIKNDPCITGSVTILTETLPWHIQYRGFRGELPNISSAVSAVSGFGYRLNNAINRCLARTTAESPAQAIIEEFIESGGGNRIFRKVKLDPSATIPCTGVEGGSTITGAFRSTGTLREVAGGVPGSSNVLIRLI